MYRVLSRQSISQTNPSFHPETVTDFHLNQQLHLPIFILNEEDGKLHMLDRQTLAFYLRGVDLLDLHQDFLSQVILCVIILSKIISVTIRLLRSLY